MRFRTAAAATTLVALLGTAGCSADDEPTSPRTEPTLADSAGRPVPTERAGDTPTIHGRYSVRLALLGRGSEDRSYELELTNTGRSDDRYLVTLVPTDAGMAGPTRLELSSGSSADLTVRLAPEPPPGTESVTVVVRSAGARDELSSFELPDAVS